MQKRFSNTELKEIEDAVERVENRFPVELVPMFANQSSSYPIAKFRALFLALLTGYGVLVLANLSISFAWFPFYIQGMLWILWVMLWLVLVEQLTGIKKMFLSRAELEDKTYNQAQQEFIKQEVYTNPNRIGILLFISYFERKFHVVCDHKIAQRIEQKQWDDLANAFATNMHTSPDCKAVIMLIDQCGELLAKAGLESDKLPPSILPNNLRV